MRTSRVLMVSSAGLSASALTFVVLVLAQRRLDADAFVDFGVVWGLIFGSASILSAFELESARATSAGERLPIRFAATAGIGAAVAVVAVSPLLVRGFSLSGTIVLLGLVVSLAIFPLNTLTRGWLAGTDRLGSYAAASLLEGGFRLAPLLLFAAVKDWHFTLAAGVGVAAFLPWFPQLLRRREMDAQISFRTEARHAFWSLGPLMSGQVAAAILITGMPATLTVVLGDRDAEGIALALVLVAISRLPLVLISSVYGLLVPWFYKRRAAPPVLAWRMRWEIAVPGTVALIGFGALALQIVASVFFDIDGKIGFWLAVLFVAGGLGLGCLQILTARLVAHDRHSTVQLVWWASVGVALATLVIGRITTLTPAIAVGLAQWSAPTIGLAILYTSALRPKTDRANDR